MKIATQSLLKQFIGSIKDLIRTLDKLTTPRPRTIPSNCVNINALLMHLCDFDQPAYRYILKWLAYPLANPGVKMQYALVVNGPQGTGSSLFFDRVVAAIYGDEARRVAERDLTRSFNGWMDGARFITVEDELTFKGRAALKALITEPSIVINQKGRETHVVPNHMNFVHVSSSMDFLPLSASDRRFMVIEAPPAREQLFYKAVAEEIKNGGVDAFRNYLMSSVDLSHFNQFEAPPKPLQAAKLERA